MPLNPESDYVRKLAARNLKEADARLFEPRLFADHFAFDGDQQRIFADPDVFRNGEKFPMRITHIIVGVEYEAQTTIETPPRGDERAIQRYGLRIRAHDTYYMNALSTPLPLWANTPIAASDVITYAQACWRLERPVILGNRDTFEIKVALIFDPGASTERVACAVDGVGLYSRQPKRLTGYIDLTDTLEHAIDSDDFRNDGTEPFEIHTITLHHTPATNSGNPVGNLRNVRARMRINGNGTNQWWDWRRNGAVASAGGAAWTDQLIPAHLFGVQTGRAVVHRLPGDGWLWYPNEGVTVEMEAFVTSRSDTLWLAMAGYIMVL